MPDADHRSRGTDRADLELVFAVEDEVRGAGCGRAVSQRRTASHSQRRGRQRAADVEDRLAGVRAVDRGLDALVADADDRADFERAAGNGRIGVERALSREVGERGGRACIGVRQNDAGGTSATTNGIDQEAASSAETDLAAKSE
jgi:hypothetical protein